MRFPRVIAIFLLSCAPALALDLIYDTATGKASLAPKVPTLMDPFEPQGYSTREIPTLECEEALRALRSREHSLSKALEKAPEGLFTQGMSTLERPDPENLAVFGDWLQGKGHSMGELIALSLRYEEARQANPNGKETAQFLKEAQKKLEELAPDIFPRTIKTPMQFRLRNGIPYEVRTPMILISEPYAALGEIPTLRSFVLTDFSTEGSLFPLIGLLRTHLKNIKAFQIEGQKGIDRAVLSSSHLETIQNQLPQLLALGLTGLDFERFLHLSRFSNLVSLDLSRTGFTSWEATRGGPLHFPKNLRHLNLSDTAHVMESFVAEQLPSLTQLESLDLSGTFFSNDPHWSLHGITSRIIEGALPNLKFLRVENVGGFSGDVIERLVGVRPEINVIYSDPRIHTPTPAQAEPQARPGLMEQIRNWLFNR